MNEHDIKQDATNALDQSVNELSPELQKKLYQARQTALSSGQSQWFKKPWVGLAVAASVGAVMLINVSTEKRTSDIDLAQPHVEDFMLLTHFDETDLEIAEDLEFAYWLAEQLDDEATSETLSGDLRNG